jgi:hypothetical protein
MARPGGGSTPGQTGSGGTGGSTGTSSQDRMQERMQQAEALRAMRERWRIEDGEDE